MSESTLNSTKEHNGFPPPFPPLVLPPDPETFDDLRLTCESIRNDRTHSDAQINDGIVKLCQRYFKWHQPKTQQEIDFYKQCVQERRDKALEDPIVEALRLDVIFQDEADEHLEEIGGLREELKSRTIARSINKKTGVILDIVSAKGLKDLEKALKQSKAGKDGAKAACLLKTGQEKKDRIVIMTDFNARLKENHDHYKRDDIGYKSVETIAKETAKAHPNATGKPIMSGEAIKREHYRRAKRKTKRAK